MTPMLATENLMQEHQLILKYIALMERYAKLRLQAIQAALFLEKAGHFIEFIHEFADAFHHAKEEAILFRYLDVPGVLTHCNPVPQMLLEHGKARDWVRGMEQALYANDSMQLGVNVDQYAALLKAHIYKEDSILYPMAERGLTDAAKTALLQEYAETDNRLHRQTLWQKYEQLYGELETALNALQQNSSV
jgi:hemerythrin-like domain-containing protein